MPFEPRLPIVTVADADGHLWEATHNPIVPIDAEDRIALG